LKNTNLISEAGFGFTTDDTCDGLPVVALLEDVVESLP